MKKDYTDITVLLDRSGSMEQIKSDMEGGFNTFRDEQKKVKGTLTVTLYQFDKWGSSSSLKDGLCLEKIYENKDISNVPDLEIIPRGTTPLIDAACKAIREVGERYNHMSEDEKPENIIFIIITDGLENASIENSKQILKNIIKEQTEKYNWEFVYLGANQDAFTEALAYGINSGSTISYASTPGSVKTLYQNLNAAVTRSRTSDEEYDNFFEEEDQHIENK